MPRTTVKTRRTYDSSRRRASADARRQAVQEAAGVRFLRDGYAATTIASIAADAGVSVEMVYKAFGGKPGLVRALWDSGLAGDAPVHAEVRSDEVSSSGTDPQLIIATWAQLSTEVAPRVAPLLLLIRRAAETDAEMQSLRDELDAERLTRMARNADALVRAGHLRDGVSRDQARDVLLTYSTPEIYDLLVLRQGWSLGDYAEFIRRGITAALL